MRLESHRNGMALKIKRQKHSTRMIYYNKVTFAVEKKDFRYHLNVTSLTLPSRRQVQFLLFCLESRVRNIRHLLMASVLNSL